MTEIGTGDVIYELRRDIQRISSELTDLENDSKNIPELIKSTNLLRTNDHLRQINLKRSELNYAYKQYSDQLEKMLSIVFDIQKDLKEILKSQSSLIAKNLTKKTKIKKSSKK